LKLLAPLAVTGTILLFGGYTFSQCLYIVKPGQVSIKFNKITGLSPTPHYEGLNYAIP